MSQESERTYHILAYGVEKLGLTAPSEPLTDRNFKISFEPFNTSHRFDEYDGVILFQGIFESFEQISNYHASYVKHECCHDELDKRKKEAQLLLENKGLLCFLLHLPFVDHNDRADCKGTDLAKYHLNYQSLRREAFNQRFAHIDVKSDGFRPFLKRHGAAYNHFRIHNTNLDSKTIAELGGRTVGMVINRGEYFIPTLVPDNRPENIVEFFTSLAEGLTSSFNKLQLALPEWINTFQFEEEQSLDAERNALLKRVHDINERFDSLSRYKSVLALSGDDLVESVAHLFSAGFGVDVDTTDELREDTKLLDERQEVICLCEVKGTNKGVKREHINQADSHRERSGFDEKFPSILIVNTHIKNARTVPEKDQEIANEQILHAVKMNILVLRTVDLLELLRLHLIGKLTKEDIVELLTTNCGWLRLIDGETSIIQQNT